MVIDMETFHFLLPSSTEQRAPLDISNSKSFSIFVLCGIFHVSVIHPFTLRRVSFILNGGNVTGVEQSLPSQAARGVCYVVIFQVSPYMTIVVV